jgi:hypothetical protein
MRTSKQFKRSSEQFGLALIILVLGLVILIHATSGIFYGDFWEHAALVTYLAKDPIAATHPFFQTTAAHAFLSPYIAVVALASFRFDIAPINALACVGIFNFCLFVGAICFWIKQLQPKRWCTSCTYSLLAILLLWGTDPWGYSGFFHFRIIRDVLPYPSTFALAITFIALAINSLSASQSKLIWQLLVFLLFWVVLLTHPLTSIFFAFGILAQLWCVTSRQLALTVGLQTVLGLSAIGLAAQWPYYSIVELASGAGDVYHPENKGMYLEVLSRIWPTLLASPIASWAIKDRAGQSVILIILMLIGVYIYGGLTEKYSFGRVVSIIVILMQILIAIGITRIEVLATARLPTLRILIPVTLYTSLLYVSMPWLVATSTRTLTVANSIRLGRPISLQHSYKDLLFLEQQVDAKSVVLSDINTSWIVPSIRGKVVGALHPQAFVPDQKQRFDDVTVFFEPATSIQQQISIARKYNVNFLLINKKTTPQYQELEDRFTGEGTGEITFASNKYILIKLSLLN